MSLVPHMIIDFMCTNRSQYKGHTLAVDGLSVDVHLPFSSKKEQHLR